MRFFNRWTVVTSVLPDGSASQQVIDPHGAQRASSAVLAHGRQLARPAVVLDAFAADLGLSVGWQEGLETVSANEVRLPAHGKTISLRYHATGEGVRVAEADGTPVLWDIDLPLGVDGRLAQLVPSRLIVTSTGAVQLAADIPFFDGIESIWTNDASGSHASFGILRADATVRNASVGPHAERMAICGYMEFDSCWEVSGGFVCSVSVYTSYCDDGSGGTYIPPDGGSGGSTSNNQVSDVTLHAAVDNAKANAVGKLGSTQCQAMIRNNKNAAGISLWDVMTSYAADPGTYIGSQITFANGDGTIDIASGLIPCNYGRLAWVSEPGVHTVDVCGSFSSLSAGMGGVTLIHEMLHTLGLPEGPPDYTSDQIQQMVIDWCGSQ
jgi:hypothetical protein